MRKNYIIWLLASLAAITGCDGFLNREPESSLSPGQYLTTEENIASYATDLYNMLPVHGETSWGVWKNDQATDNIAYSDPSDYFAPGYWRVSQTGGSWSFTEIYRCNYFFDNVLDNFNNGKISGSGTNIRHYIGEAYFFRALCYFRKLVALGDFPIVTKCLGDDLDELTEASRRAPRNEVARFILNDLDIAISYLQEVPPKGGTNRVSRDCARMLKSRVALFEGTWLKYFKGTAFVPGTDDWPGKAYNPDFAWPLGSIDAEIDWFLDQCIAESAIIADKYPLTENTGLFQDSAAAAPNPYFDMFGSTDMSIYPEVMLWKQYSVSEGVVNSVVEFAAAANQGYGTLKGMVDAYVMANGKPIYAAGSGYPGDNDLQKITDNRDSRAVLFIKKPGDTNLHSTGGPESFMVEPWPNLVNSTASMKYTTGYALRKGLNFDGAMSVRNKSTVGCIIFRAVEAYLNYMEAYYEKNGSLDDKAKGYWTAIRDRAHVGDWQISIDNTNMTEEAKGDWGAYSAGVLVDKTLFNIRRERRCEMLGEGLRALDIRRWRAMDQMISTPWHPMGINLWTDTYTNADFLAVNNNNLKEGENVSPKTFSKYLAPYHILANNRVYDGYRWKMAHYLEPIAVQHLLITGGGDASKSVVYQNPGWPIKAGLGAQ